jgi:hypothetical protein
MSIKAFLIGLLLLPGVAHAQGVPAEKQIQDLFQFYRQFFIQNPGMMQDFKLLKDGTVLHGFIQMGGTSTNTHTDLVGLARNIGTSATTFFAIPADYQWKVREGGFVGRKAVENIGMSTRNVIMDLMVDDVPLEDGYIEIMVDEQGRLRTMTIKVPRLRPEIVSSVRGPTIDAFGAAVAIRLDANQLPPNNIFMITPNTDLSYVNFRKVAIAKEPYVLYKTRVNAAEYVVNAKTGEIIVRASTMRP